MDMEEVRDLLTKVYGREAGIEVYEAVVRLVKDYKSRPSTTQPGGLDQRDTILITYADQVQQPGEHPLAVLGDFCVPRIRDTITGIHILPFYPWTSDDGFSVVNYRMVDARYGSWADMERLRRYFRLMFDAVINHVSVKSSWFQGMLKGDPRYSEYFISPNERDDLSHVVRPRTLPLLTSYPTVSGDKRIWTTFSADQVDLNYRNPKVLLEILDVLLFYAFQGAEFIRLDAIAYLWKESGTSCINLPQAHWIIQLFRAALDEVAPQVMLITETNVPHRDNISYFGDGTNEAQMVYNFSLPPLVLHAFQKGSAETLSGWAEGLKLPSDKVTFFNFLASHDGVGLNPLRGIIPESEIEAVVSRAQAHGGLVSYKTDPDGKPRPYELNINYFDALNDPAADEPLDLQIDRFITAHAILLAMKGMPGIYFHSLVGSRNWLEGVQQSGQNRTINRRKFHRDELLSALSDPRTQQARVFFRLSYLLTIRRRHPAFHPQASQTVIETVPEIFGLLRISPDGRDRVLCLQNVSGRHISLDLPMLSAALLQPSRNLISGEYLDMSTGQLRVQPYQTLWLI